MDNNRMEEKLVSIIIPVFNRDEIVGKTIESILKQTYQKLEIVIIDDGSTDNSYDKCREYAEKDARIILVRKENGGVSSARNAGLDIVQGDYVFFLDSDDYIYKDTIKNLVGCAEEFLCDIVQGNKENKLENRGGIQKTSYLEYLRSNCYMPVVWGKLFKSVLLKEIRFDETLAVSEDVDFLFRLINRVETIVCCDGKFMGTTPTKIGLTRKEYEENSLLLIRVLERVAARLEEIQDVEFAKHIYRSYACALFYNYVKAKRYRINNYKTVRKDIQRKYRSVFWQIIKANNGALLSKVACVLGWINLDIYKMKV